jgi:hypothetical protein
MSTNRRAGTAPRDPRSQARSPRLSPGPHQLCPTFLLPQGLSGTEGPSLIPLNVSPPPSPSLGCPGHCVTQETAQTEA